MRILNLHTENIKKIKAIDITPEGDTVVISGKNGNGKSSTLDSICMVLGGKKLIPSKPVREGEETAKIELDIGDYIVTRNWTNPETSYLKVRNKDGANITNAQMILNRLIGDLSFDPLEFTTMAPAKRFDVLRKITGVDLTELTKEHGEVYAKRADTAKEGKSLNARLDTEFKDVPNFANKVDDIATIKNQRDEADTYNKSIDDYHVEFRDRERDIETKKEAIKAVSSQIDQLKSLLIKEKKTLKEQKDNFAKLQGRDITKKDLSKFDEKIEQFYEFQRCKDIQDRKKEVETERDCARELWDTLDGRLKEIKLAKTAMVANAEMPIKGLNFGDGEILFKDIPFGQLSTSEQIRVSMAIAIAMNPRLRVVMIYNASLLDSDAMSMIKSIAKEKDMQIWLEVVSDKPEGNCIFIEDGEIVK